MIHPKPTDREILLSPEDMIVSQTDARGTITYVNDTFIEISGYRDDELIGTSHNILRHPDMPKAIFYRMWQHIKNGRNITAVIKNLAKSGDHYWVVTDFEIRRDSSGKIKSYVAYRQAAPEHVVSEIAPLYHQILEREKSDGMDASMDYLESFLHEKGMTYNQYIEQLVKEQGMTDLFFEKKKLLFS